MTDAAGARLPRAGLRARRARRTPAAPTGRPPRSRRSSRASSRASPRSSRACPRRRRNRTHCIAWSDWATRGRGRARPRHPPRHQLLLLAAGLGARTARASSPARACRCASPTRTAALIDVYQAATQMTDESGQSYPFTIDTLLDRALGAEGYYGAFTANMHTDGGQLRARRRGAIVASAQARGVPVVSGRQMLEWLDGRNASRFGELRLERRARSSSRREPGRGSAQPARAAAGGDGGAARSRRCARGGAPVPFTLETLQGHRVRGLRGGDRRATRRPTRATRCRP